MSLNSDSSDNNINNLVLINDIKTLEYDDIKYTYIEEIAEGGFGKVYKYSSNQSEISDKTTFAIKIMNLKNNKIEETNLLNEVNNHKLMDHANVVKLYDYFAHKDYFCIVLSYEKENIFNYIYNTTLFLPNNLSLMIFQQILLGLQHIHSHNVIHRDLKLENILITHDNKIKICDFGASFLVIDNNENPKEMIGTVEYVSPQMICGNKYLYDTDIWSLGVILYELIYHVVPFKSHSLYSNIVNASYELPDQASKLTKTKDVPDNIKDLIKNILVVDQNTRLKLNNILLIVNEM